MNDPVSVGHAKGGVRTILQIEGAVLAAMAIAAFAQSGTSWWLFAALILLPDIGMVGYLANTRLGAFLYNATHTYCAPVALATTGWALGTTSLWPFACIWFTHIGLDRAIGYGLKYASAFKATHLR